MKKAVFITTLILAAAVFVGCGNNHDNPSNSSDINTALSESTAETGTENPAEDSKETLDFYDVIFGEYGVEINVSGNMEYIAKVQEANYTYLFGKTSPGDVYLTPELEAVMSDGNDDGVYAVHIIGFMSDSKGESPELADAAYIRDIVKNKGLTFDEYKSNVFAGEVYFLTLAEINELSCDDDICLVCGLAVNTNVYENTDGQEFDDKLDLLSEEDAVPVYVYYNAFSDNGVSETDTELYTDIDRIGERIEIHHNRVNDSKFQELLTNGTILNELKDLARVAGMEDSDVIYTPALSRFQTYMTAKQISMISDGCKTAIRCD